MTARHVLLTGSGGGLGTAVTAAFAQQGDVVTAVTYGGTAERLRASLGPLVDAVTVVEADLRDPAAAQAVADQMPRIDALVHLVGGFGMGPTRDATLDEFRRLVDLNFTSTFVAVRAVLPAMERQAHGRIVVVASRSAVAPAPAQAIYSASKAAVLAFAQSVAVEYQDHDITANAVLPSIIDTPANRAAMGDAQAADWVKPSSLATTIAFLASAEAGDLRGAALPCYGRA